MNSIQRWAEYMKENPTTWKREHAKFINAQFIKHKVFLEKLKQQPSGREKLKKLYNIQNEKGYEDLLK